MVATLILSLRLRIAEAGHLAVFHRNLPDGKALQYLLYNTLKYIYDQKFGVWNNIFVDSYEYFQENNNI